MTAIDYTIEAKPYEGWFVPAAGPAPLVVIAPAWGGVGELEQETARRIATEFGCAAFVLDVYGKGRRGVTPEQCQALMGPLVGDRAELQKRLAAGLAVAKLQSGVDARRAAAIGYCFGGLCVLDMARAGMDVRGVCSFHGLFSPASNIPSPRITAKVLIEHGWQDPMATPDDVLAIAREMTAAGADWRLDAHGRAVHAFTNPTAANRAGGVEYDAAADRRSWAALRDFLTELF